MTVQHSDIHWNNWTHVLYAMYTAIAPKVSAIFVVARSFTQQMPHKPARAFTFVRHMNTALLHVWCLCHLQRNLTRRAKHLWWRGEVKLKRNTSSPRHGNDVLSTARCQNIDVMHLWVLALHSVVPSLTWTYNKNQPHITCLKWQYISSCLMFVPSTNDTPTRRA